MGDTRGVRGRSQVEENPSVGGAHLRGGNGGGGSSKSGRGNDSPVAGSDRRSTGGEVGWSAVRAFCERIGARGKREGGGDPWPVMGAQRMASSRRNGRGRGSDS
jgi:hypothetical protein